MFHQRRWIFRRSRIVIWQIWTRSPEVTRVPVMPWQHSVDFSEAMCGGIAGVVSLQNCICRPSWRSMYIGIRIPHSKAVSRVGTNIFHGEQYWQGFVNYSIAMAKHLLNSICCSSFVQLESKYWKLFISYNVFPPLLSPVQCFHFLGGNIVRFNPYFHATCVGKPIGPHDLQVCLWLLQWGRCYLLMIGMFPVLRLQ